MIPDNYPMPSAGGSYMRDPVTGALTLIAPPVEADVPAPDAPAPDVPVTDAASTKPRRTPLKET